jgi:hypothetical protein
MIFTGDVAIADGDRFDFVGFPEEFFLTPMCLNLESAVKSDDSIFNTGVYNSADGLESLSGFNFSLPFLRIITSMI